MKRLFLIALLSLGATAALAAPAANELPSIPAPNGVVRATPSAIIIPEDPGNPGGAGCVVGSTGCSLPTSGGGGGGGDVNIAQVGGEDISDSVPVSGNVSLSGPIPAGANTIGSIANTAFGATQSGTWTMQPGNTPNTTPWLATISQAGLSAAVGPSSSSTIADTVNGLTVRAQLNCYNGSTWNRAATAPASTGTGFGVCASVPVPCSDVACGVVPTATTAVASSLPAKTSAGNLYSWRVTAGASAGYVMVFNATSAPADGAVTPADCAAVAANSTISSPSAAVPERFSTGITLVFSTTGCFLKTASATAYIRATVQ